MNPSRRDFLKRSGLGGVGLLTFSVAGCEKRMTPATARAERTPLGVLSDAERQALEALGDILVPGSAKAGLAHYVDHQLAAAEPDCMLMIRYLGVNAPFTPFYSAGLAALDRAAEAQFGGTFATLSQSDAASLAGQMAGGEMAGWEGPPPGFFFFVTRSDAVDVRYGTQAGFAQLGVPYMAHILPPSNWGE